MPITTGMNGTGNQRRCCWLFKLPLIVTFILHIPVMNFVVGGGVLALTSNWRSRNRESDSRLFLNIARKLPVFLPATITLGAAPSLHRHGKTVRARTSSVPRLQEKLASGRPD